jgi:hypothetical protein
LIAKENKKNMGKKKTLSWVKKYTFITHMVSHFKKYNIYLLKQTQQTVEDE